jgi:two-component system OmpR family sensor kinase
VLANLLGNAGRHTPPGTTVTIALSQAGTDDARRDEGAPGHDRDGVPSRDPSPGRDGVPGSDGVPGRDGVPAGTAVLSVTDDGPGIPAELLPELFERFVRGDSSRSRAAGSTGLGLAIVDAVVGAHGGRVEVTSEPGRTAFVIRLPVSGAGSPPPDRS